MQNDHRLSSNPNRPNRAPGKVFRWYEIKWDILSASAAPKSPHALSDDLIQLVLDIRDQLKCCAEVVWYYINAVLKYSPILTFTTIVGYT